MHEAVPAARSRPILVQGPERAAFTQIAVSAKVFFFNSSMITLLLLVSRSILFIVMLKPSDLDSNWSSGELLLLFLLFYTYEQEVVTGH